MSDEILDFGVKVNVKGINEIEDPRTATGFTLAGGFKGVVVGVRLVTDRGPRHYIHDVINIETGGLHSVPRERLVVRRRGGTDYDNFYKALDELPRPSSAGKTIASPGESATIADRLIKQEIADLHNVKERNMAKAAKAAKAQVEATPGEEKVKAPKVKKARSKVDLTGVKAEDFFQTNAKGKSVFKVGADARYKGILRRIADGTAGPEDKRLAFQKGLTEHPKVAESPFFQALLTEARAKAA